MFKKTKEYAKIKTELELINILDKKAHFECYSDSVFGFGYTQEDNVTYHEFCFICENDILNEMLISEILELKRIVYFCHNIYYVENEHEEKKISECSWSLAEYSGLN